MKKFFRKFFSWTLIYKTLALVEGVYSYLKDYYYVSDTLYSEEFKYAIKKILNIDLDKDWIGRLYGILNPNIGPDGKYDFSNTIYEVDGENTNNDEFVKNIIYGKMDILNRQLHIGELYDYINVNFEKVGPSYADNYLVVFDIVTRAYAASCFKKWIAQIAIYGVIAAIVCAIIL